MRTILLILGVSLGISVQAQADQYAMINAKADHPTDWTIYTSNSEYEIYYKFETCDPSIGYNNESVLLRLINKSPQKQVFNWFQVLHYDNECLTCDYPGEYTYEISVPSASSVEGDCTVYSDYRLKIFSKFDDPNYSKGGKVLTSFQLKDIKVTSY